MNEQIEVLEKVRGTISSIKHDINNPVAVISGNAQLLRELASADQQEEYVESLIDIEEAARQITNLLDRLDVLGEYLDKKGITSKNRNIFSE